MQTDSLRILKVFNLELEKAARQWAQTKRVLPLFVVFFIAFIDFRLIDPLFDRLFDWLIDWFGCLFSQLYCSLLILRSVELLNYLIFLDFDCLCVVDSGWWRRFDSLDGGKSGRRSWRSVAVSSRKASREYTDCIRWPRPGNCPFRPSTWTSVWQSPSLITSTPHGSLSLKGLCFLSLFNDSLGVQDFNNGLVSVIFFLFFAWKT